ncbi:histone deacetylase family protein [Methylomonas sp. EFPC3]|uniref:histone deacetylase family protein n=1 Tax=Methylomonas sp. EFPC3 TaxID=3021710 RepID=UPI002415A676|nr:histone deacetylase family protein [Methylomonas sp. EFPC3]WFP51475.1 histone deacetylase family protein [Methylomonas sp. EFPC3]
MRTLYYSHPDFLAHDTGLAHPECPERLRVIAEALAAPKFAALTHVQAALPDDIEDKIGLVHGRAMIAKLLAEIPEHGLTNLDADTVVSPGSRQAALLAVAAVCDAVDKVCGGAADNAFCAVRPPGHHAMPDYPMGFCLFNNVAIAAEYARKGYGLERIAIVDFDVHHGNGTQAAFYDQPQVLYISSHQWPHYPGSGHPSEHGAGNILNLALATGSDGEVIRAKYRDTVFPALRKFAPQLVLISAGFDAHKDDPLASLRLTEADYHWLTEQLRAIAEDYCQGRLISVLEGGYNLRALANSVAAHVAALMGLVNEGV